MSLSVNNAILQIFTHFIGTCWVPTSVGCYLCLTGNIQGFTIWLGPCQGCGVHLCSAPRLPPGEGGYALLTNCAPWCGLSPASGQSCPKGCWFPLSEALNCFLKRFYCFIFRERRVGERRRETSTWERNIYRLPLLWAPTGDQIHSSGMCPSQESNWWPFVL